MCQDSLKTPEFGGAGLSIHEQLLRARPFHPFLADCFTGEMDQDSILTFVNDPRETPICLSLTQRNTLLNKAKIPFPINSLRFFSLEDRKYFEKETTIGVPFVLSAQLKHSAL